MHEHRLPCFRGVVARATRVSGLRGRRRDVQRVGVAASRADPLPQQRKQRRRHELRRQHVRLEHPPPVVGLAVLDAIGAPRAARDMDEGVHVAGGCQVLREGGDVGLSAEVGGERGRTDLGIQSIEPVRATRDADDVPARRPERPHHRLADARARSGHHCSSVPRRVLRRRRRHVPHATRPGRADCDVTFPDRC